MRDSERYALEAEKLERQAEAAHSSMERQAYLDIAASYRKLADDAVHFELRYGIREKPEH